MRIIALAGISPHALSELIKNHIKTLNLKSADNLLALKSVDVGDFVFITSVVKDDIIPGTEGIIGRIRKISIIHQKTPPEVSEERECVVGKVQIEMIGFGTCVDIAEMEVLSPLILDVVMKSIY
ncbi:DUF473 domain-containing protein [Methanotorris igneus]|uniref:DUF473 domain-containing protein n=1 Tax=Methanotorris igneus (strain DSM 5666 / JCM 11834 / Kol 5) TaxID=880724 RepID=F6BD12_METIK|nr:DUF473 domain-containing protein [Methanotorris igneus]AEF96373.1 protein of unknown function DUF473 [Methanotorris igneus Kol 5]